MFFSGRELVTIAIGIERNGLAFYQSLLKAETNTMVERVYRRLAEMEEQHIATFNGMLDTIGEFKSPEIDAEEYSVYLQALIDSGVFADDKLAREMAKKVTSSAEAIQVGMGAEKDAILFYSEMRNLVPEVHRKTVDSIIEEERSHLRGLVDLKKKLSAG